MTGTESSVHARAALNEGRANQKRRTQRALIEAALALCDEGAGRTPTFGEVAERAMVSRGTAYRYYASVEALIAEALFERALGPGASGPGVAPGADPVAAIGQAAREFNRLLLQDESALRVMLRSFMSVWLENEPSKRPPRPARRMHYIDPVLDALAPEVPDAARARLRHALSLVMGPEALVALRDAAGASVDEALDASAWAAQALVRQARAEAAGTGEASAAAPRARRRA